VTDSHAHLDACEEPAAALVERARAAGVTRIVTIGTGIDSCRAALAIADAHEGVHAALGGRQGVFHMATPLTMAETASVFGETLVFGRLFERAGTAESRLALLAESIEVPDHLVKVGRRDIRLREMGHDALKEVFSKSSLTEAARGDVRLLMTVGNLWGADSLSRFQFVNGSRPEAPSKLSSIIHGLRR